MKPIAQTEMTMMHLMYSDVPGYPKFDPNIRDKTDFGSQIDQALPIGNPGDERPTHTLTAFKFKPDGGYKGYICLQVAPEGTVLRGNMDFYVIPPSDWEGIKEAAKDFLKHYKA